MLGASLGDEVDETDGASLAELLYVRESGENTEDGGTRPTQPALDTFLASVVGELRTGMA